MNMSQYYDDYWSNKTGVPPVHRAWTEQRMAGLHKALQELPKNSIILDAGCGEGHFVALMANWGYRVIGIDIAELPLTRVEHHDHIVGYCVASVEGRLPFPSGYFDAVWSTEVIEHLIYVDRTMAEFNRILKPGGQLIITTPYHGIIKNLVLSLHGFETHYDPAGPHIRFYTRKSLNRCLTDAGFKGTIWKGVGRYWPVWMSHFTVARKAKAIENVWTSYDRHMR